MEALKTADREGGTQPNECAWRTSSAPQQAGWEGRLGHLLFASAMLSVYLLPEQLSHNQACGMAKRGTGRACSKQVPESKLKVKNTRWKGHVQHRALRHLARMSTHATVEPRHSVLFCSVPATRSGHRTRGKVSVVFK